MKKPSTINISVESPCGQNWGAMLPADSGRHCDSCNKTVTDFSNFTDKELIAFLQKAKGEVCGRLNEYQVERPLYLPATNNNSFLSKALVGTALIAGIVATANGQDTHKVIAPVQVPVPTPPSVAPINDTTTAKNDIVSPVIVTTAPPQIVKDSSKKLIHGKVIDAKTKEPLADTYVEVIGSPNYVQTDANGMYQIYVPDSMCNKEIQIEFYRWAHKIVEKTVQSGKHSINMNVAMEYKEERKIMGKMRVSR